MTGLELRNSSVPVRDATALPPEPQPQALHVSLFFKVKVWHCCCRRCSRYNFLLLLGHRRGAVIGLRGSEE